MATHGYHLFGMGARVSGFTRTAAPTPALIDDWKAVYGHRIKRH